MLIDAFKWTKEERGSSFSLLTVFYWDRLWQIEQNLILEIPLKELHPGTDTQVILKDNVRLWK